MADIHSKIVATRGARRIPDADSGSPQNQRALAAPVQGLRARSLDLIGLAPRRLEPNLLLAGAGGQMRGAGLIVLGLLAAVPARAGEPADRGISMTAWAGAAVDRSVSNLDSGQPLHDGSPLVGVTALGNIRTLAIGGAVDGTPGINGDGRLAIAALLGYAPEVNRLRLQFLGEAGRHRFSDVGGNLYAHQVGPDTWLPYVGMRLGVARTVPAHGMFEAGAWLFGRYDIGHATVTNVGSMFEETRTDYRVGGWMCGLALQIGIRLEAADPRRTEEMMAAR